MYRDEMLQAITGFYRLIWKDKNNELYPSDFTVVGSGSLVIQGLWQSAEDIDMMAHRHKMDSLRHVLEKENILADERKFKRADETYFRFVLDNRQFDLFAKEAGEYWQDDLDVTEKISHDGFDIYYRPKELIMNDYNNIIKGLCIEAIVFGTNVRMKIEKYQKVLDHLEKA